MNVERTRLRDGWLAEIAAVGWRKAAMAGAAARADVSEERLRRMLGERSDAVAALQADVARAAIAATLEAGGSVRDRLFDGLMAGFDMLQESRAAVVTVWRSRDPAVAAMLATRGLFDVRRLALAAGIEVRGVRGRLRLLALAGLCLQAFRAWSQDESADMAATMAVLDKLLERAETAEAEGPSPDLIGLPGLTSLLSRLPLPRLRGNGDRVPPPSPDLPAG